MPKKQFNTVDEYLASQPEATRAILSRVRAAIRKAAPKAEEAISYGIPAYRLNGRAILYFAGWKQHFSLYPAGDRLVDAFKDELAKYEIDKGTIRFPLSMRPPVTLISQIAKFRAQEAANREKKPKR